MHEHPSIFISNLKSAFTTANFRLSHSNDEIPRVPCHFFFPQVLLVKSKRHLGEYFLSYYNLLITDGAFWQKYTKFSEFVTFVSLSYHNNAIRVPFCFLLLLSCFSVVVSFSFVVSFILRLLSICGNFVHHKNYSLP